MGRRDMARRKEIIRKSQWSRCRRKVSGTTLTPILMNVLQKTKTEKRYKEQKKTSWCQLHPSLPKIVNPYKH